MKDKTKTKEKKPRSVGSIIVNVVLIAAVTLLVIAIITAIRYKNNPDDAYLFGIKPIYIQTGSMEPTLRTGSIAIVKKAEFSDFEVNDIVVFVKDEKLITHRVMQVEDGFLKTKGDNNKIFDNFSVYPEEIRAKVLFPMNFIATITSEIGTPKGIFKFIVFPIICIIIIVITVKIIKKIAASPEEAKPSDTKTLEAQEVLALSDNITSASEFDDIDEDMYFTDDDEDETEDEHSSADTPPEPESTEYDDDLFDDDENIEQFIFDEHKADSLEQEAVLPEKEAVSNEPDTEEEPIERINAEEEIKQKISPKIEIIKERKPKKKKKPKRPANEDDNEQVIISSKREMEDWRCN